MSDTENDEIEITYPDAYRLARKFHELYEETAPKFGYTTRGDTKEFDPRSPNGRTMAYVCKTIVDEEREEAFALGEKTMLEKVRNHDWTFSQTGVAIGTKKAVIQELLQALTSH